MDTYDFLNIPTISSADGIFYKQKGSVMTIKIPTAKTLQSYWKKRYAGESGDRYKIADDILTDLFKKYQKNKSADVCFMKSMLLNSFYSTHIIDIRSVAENINLQSAELDKLLNKGNYKAVEIIRRTGKHDIYSFATKYCFFSNPRKYSIYDKYVALLLTDYIMEYKLYEKPNVVGLYKNRRISKTGIRNDLRNYEIFMNFINAFMKLCGTNDRMLIDNFLWIKGKELYPNKK